MNQNQFILKRASQTSNLPDSLNRVSVTLSGNIAFRAYDMVIISGLVGARSLTDILFIEDYGTVSLLPNPDHNGVVKQDRNLFSRPSAASGAWSPGTGAWMQCNSEGKTCNAEISCVSSEIHLQLTGHVAAGQNLTFAFQLLNPSKPYTPGDSLTPMKLQVHAKRGLASLIAKAEFESQVEIPSVLDRSLISAMIAQSNSRPGEVNTLSVTLKSSVQLSDVAPAAYITIYPLLGARYSSSTAKNGPIKLDNLISPPVGIISDVTRFDSGYGGTAGYGLWDNAMKSLTLRITSNGLEADKSYAFTFKIQNPWNTELQQAPVVYARMQVGTYIKQTTMTTATDPLLRAMYVKATRFLNTTQISQSSDAPNSINNIQLSFETNVVLVPGAEVIVSGINGSQHDLHSQTPGGETMLRHDVGIITTYICLRQRGEVVGSSLKDAVYLRIDSEVLKVEQVVSGQLSASALKEAGYQAGVSCDGWLEVTRGLFGTAAVMHIADALVYNVLPLQHSTTGQILAPVARWNRAQGTLALMVTANSEFDKVYSLSFALRNPLRYNPQPSVSIESTLVSISRIPLYSPRERDIPLNVIRPEFVVKNISQSSSFPAGNNSLRVELISSLALRGDEGASITLFGLTGAGDGSSDDPQITGDAIWDSTADWDREDGTLKLNIQAGRIMQAGVKYVFSFRLLNPDNPGPADIPSKAVEIEARIADTVQPLIERSVMNQTADKERQVLFVSTPKFITATAVQEHPYPGAMNEISFWLVSNKHLVGPSADGTGGDKIGIMGMLGTLPAETGEPDSGVTLKIKNNGVGDMADVVGGSGTWSRKDGSLVLELGVGKRMVAGQTYSFNITLRNPAGNNDPSTATASICKDFATNAHTCLTVNASSIKEVDGEPTVQTIIEATPIVLDLNQHAATQKNWAALRQRMGADREAECPDISGKPLDQQMLDGFVTCPSSIAGQCCPTYKDMMPLRTHAPQLLRMEIGNSSRLPGVLNTIRARIVATVEVFELVLCGLTDTQTPGRGQSVGFDEIPFAVSEGSLARQVFGTKGFWTQASGTIVLRRLPNELSPPGAQHAFTFVVDNPIGPKAFNWPTPWTSQSQAGSTTFAGKTAPQIDVLLTFQKPFEATCPRDKIDGACPLTYNPLTGDAFSGCLKQCQNIGAGYCYLASRLQSAGASFGVLEVEPPDFVFTQIGQTNTFPGAANTISVTLATNIAVQTDFNPTVTIGGLSGTLTATGSLVITSRIVSGFDAGLSQTFGQSGEWDGTAGLLTVPLSANMDRQKNYSLSFEVFNSVSCGTAGAPECGKAVETTIAIETQIGKCRPVVNGEPAREDSQCPSETCAVLLDACSSRLIFTQKVMKAAAGSSAPLFVDAPALLVKTIAQTSSLPGQTNEIVVSLVFNIKLAASAKVTITGLIGAESPTSVVTLTQLQGPVAQVFGTTATFSAAEGTLTLEMQTANAPDPDNNQEFVMSFPVRNAMTAQDAMHVNISAVGASAASSGASITLAPTRMAGKVLNISQAEFSHTRAGQSSSFPGASNTISITLTPNTDLRPPFALTVSGLFGAKAPSGTIAVTATGGISFTGTWDQGQKMLVLDSVASSVDATATFSISFVVANRVSPQLPPKVQVAVSRYGSMLIFASHLQNAAGSAAVLAIDGRAWITRYIQQHTSKPGATNTLTVTLRPNYLVPTDTRISILGLFDAAPVAGQSLLPLVSYPNSADSCAACGYFGRLARGYGTWDEEDAGLMLFVNTYLQQAADVAFSFAVRNPTAPQASPRVALRTTVVLIPQQRLTVQQTGAPGSASTALSVQDLGVQGKIWQSSSMPAAVNTLYVEMQFNFHLSDYLDQLSLLRVSISGLISPNRTSVGVSAGSVEVGTTWTVGAGGNSIEWRRMGEWNEELGVMVLRPALSAVTYSSLPCCADQTLKVAWNIVNPASQQEPPARVSLSLSNSNDSLVEAWETSTHLAYVEEPPAHQPVSRAGDAHPLRVHAPAFVGASMAQSSPWPGAQNTLTLTLLSNIALSYPAAVTVSGLVGTSLTQADVRDSLVQAGSLPPKQRYNGTHWNSMQTSPFHHSNVTWDAATGTLVVAIRPCVDTAGGLVCYALDAGERQEISLQLVNPTAERAPVALSIAASRHLLSGSQQVIPAAPLPVSPHGVVWRATERCQNYTQQGAVCGASCTAPLQTAADAGPLRVQPKRFVVKRLHHSSVAPGGMNVITVTLATNVGCVSSACSNHIGEVRIHNLTPFFEPVASGQNTEHTLQLFGLNGQGVSAETPFSTWKWNATTATVTLPLKRQHKFLAGDHYIMAFTLKNPTRGGQTAGNASVSLWFDTGSGLSEEIGKSDFDAPPGVCEDLASWKDSDDKTCADYAATPVMCDGIRADSVHSASGGLIFPVQYYKRARTDITETCHALHNVPLDASLLCCACRQPTSGGGQIAAAQLQRLAIAQSSADPDSDNVVTVTLQSNVALPRSTLVTISGLVGSDTASSDTLPLQNSISAAKACDDADAALSKTDTTLYDQRRALCLAQGCCHYDTANHKCESAVTGLCSPFGSMARWHQATGTLTLNVTRELTCKAGQCSTSYDAHGVLLQRGASSGILAGDVVFVRVSLRNPRSARTPAGPWTVNATNALLGPIINTSLLQTAAGPLAGRPGSVAGDARPLTVRAPALTVRQIEQASAYPGARNSLHFTVASNVLLSHAFGDKLVVHGLSGANASDGVIALDGTDRDLFGESMAASGTGKWKSSDRYQPAGSATEVAAPSLSLLLHPQRNMTAGTQFSFSINVTNPTAAQASPDIWFVHEPAGTRVYTLTPVLADKPTGNLLAGEVVVGTKQPLAIAGSQWLWLQAVQTSMYPGQLNTLIVSLVPSVAVTTDTWITVIGLQGAESNKTWIPVGTSVLAGSPAANVGKGRWRSVRKQLLVRCTQTLAAGALLTMNFSLHNPRHNQSGPQLAVHTSTTVAEVLVKAGHGCTQDAQLQASGGGGADFAGSFSVSSGAVTVSNGGQGFLRQPLISIASGGAGWCVA